MEPPQQPTRTLIDRVSAVFLNDRGLRAGWRLMVFVAILLLIYLLSLMLTAPGGAPAVRTAPASELARQAPRALVELGLFLAVLMASWLMSRLEQRPLSAYGLNLHKSAIANFLRGCFLWGFLPLAVLLVVMRALGVFYFGSISNLGWTTFSWALLWGACFLLVGLYEEYLFRGYSQFTLAEGIGFWPAAIILAMAFATLHMINRGETRIGIVGTAAFALFAAATLWRTGDLWLAVGAHAGWDWGQTFFFGVSDSGFVAPGHLFNPRSAGPDWLSGGSAGPEGSVLVLILLPLMTVLFIKLDRPRRERSRIIPAEDGK